MPCSLLWHVWRITLRFAAFPPETLRFALCCSLCSLLLHLCPSSSLSPAQHRRVILCFSLYYTHSIQVHCTVAHLFRNAVGAGGWTSVSGNTFDLSALKLTDGSYSPSAFSDEHGQFLSARCSPAAHPADRCCPHVEPVLKRARHTNS